MTQLERITIRGYKSIRDLEDFELGSLNVLIGANGAGKSNFISLFELLAAAEDGRLDQWVAVNDGPDALLFGGRKQTSEITVELALGSVEYRNSLVPAGARLVLRREFILAKTDPIVRVETPELRETGTPYSAGAPGTPPEEAYVRVSIANWRVYHFHDTSPSAPARQAQPVRDNLLLKADGANLAPYLRMLREHHPNHYRHILEAVRLVAPFFGDFVYRKDPGERVELEWTHLGDPDTPLSPRQLSDGTLRFICFATLLVQPVHLQPDTILIDEPELGLHPFAIAILASLFRQAAEGRQLIVSTQSVELVNELDPLDVVVVGREDGASTFKRLDPGELTEWLEDYSLGELWKSGVIGGRPTR